MKLKNKLIAAICLALVACMTMSLPVFAQVKANSTLKVSKTKLTLSVGETQSVKLTWTNTTGSLSYAWDNAAVIKFNSSESWSGHSKNLYVTGVAAGKTTITITDTTTKDKVKIAVTVKDGSKQDDVRELMGLSLKKANQCLDDKLKASGKKYSNGYLNVTLNAFKRVKDITILSGQGRYTLFSVYPGMSFSKAAAKLKSLGWKQARKRGASYYYLNDEHLCKAICVVKKGAKVSSVRYYLP